ncbi:hypothetical protein BFP97_04130 [Roseivirga sp. 4D4]|uniref:LytR/AlgR family response regulator transcription factor n=1 Tax=Roseivirga sp. 4D4 TaxID=1889784 RepID=UPI0008536437|nr:LytTR family DNA-binding domain-containing protein [Roseivirga sp. 4D4]OEK00745.1 hypothetical protein BFP97_04130 [Roseivirga sp. 4D4]
MSQKRLLLWVFHSFTLIAGIQFLQYYIFYNSSYPFPYTANLVNSFGTFYTYLLLLPLVFYSAKSAFSNLENRVQRMLLLVLSGLLVSMLHLFVMHFVNWLQIYQWTEDPFWNSYRFLISKWLHFELIAYFLFVLAWRFLVFEKKGSEASKPEYWTQIKVKEAGLVSFVPVEEIRWIEAYDNYIKVRTKKDKFHLVRMPLREIEAKLDSGHFKRIHRSTIVAIREVVAIHQDNGQYRVLLEDNSTLKLSRTFKKSIEDSIRV